MMIEPEDLAATMLPPKHGPSIEDVIEEARAKHTADLVAHISAVQEFGRRMGIDEDQLQRHDLSKWKAPEFDAYMLHFVFRNMVPEIPAAAQDRIKAKFAHAWLHHIHCNPHHWQHWIFPDGYNPNGADLENGVMEMPFRYAREMIADWHGAGYVYQGSYDIAPWLAENMPRIVVHSRTALLLREILDQLGYADTVWTTPFKAEIDAL